MSLPAGVFSINAATVAGPGKSILPAPPKKLRRSFGISTIASSLGSMVFPSLAVYPIGPAILSRPDRSAKADSAWPGRRPEWRSRESLGLSSGGSAFPIVRDAIPARLSR